MSHRQLAIVSAAANGLPPEKRLVFLDRVASALRRQKNFTDVDVMALAQQALSGLIQQVA